MTVAASSAAVERFVLRAERLGVRLHRCSGDGVAAAVIAALRAEAAASAMVADDLGHERDVLLAALTDAGVTTIDGATPLEADPAEAGVTRAAFGVAEMGALGVLGNELQPRMATMLPPVHVAILDASAVYRSLDEAFEHLERAMGREGLRYASLVAGPSRTADVEKTLAVGVHGPRVLHVVLVG